MSNKIGYSYDYLKHHKKFAESDDKIQYFIKSCEHSTFSWKIQYIIDKVTKFSTLEYFIKKH
jgi:hypothetical protein